ncbi:phosphoribosyltransferase [Agrobacterium pusense]|uniref:phosphoribosyltransferase n=1 Tax=Agrobacterium pusense TaxID=648995 RepID=UPI001AE861FA|nr:phosphoribosyltransferase family protein [Agrobacterium pusense]MBP2611444.1 phosphoribosylpyrophosphate synthetase [Agrobacterium pusense]
MIVHFISAYYSDRAHRKLKARTPEYWDAYMFVWAIKIGQFKSGFTIHLRKRKLQIKADTIHLAREMFGKFIDHRLKKDDVDHDVLLIPVPSKDALVGAGSYRSLEMLEEAMENRDFKSCVTDGIRWTKKLAKSHEGGHHNRDYWKPHLDVIIGVDGKDVILVDDVLSTGGTMLAAKEALEEAGANVLFAIACGKTVYDFELKPFGAQQIDLEDEIHDYDGE